MRFMLFPLLFCTTLNINAQQIKPAHSDGLSTQQSSLARFNLDNVQKNMLQAIIEQAEFDKKVDIKYHNGLQGTFGDLSRRVTYTGNETLYLSIKSRKTGDEHFSLKPTHISYGHDQKLRSIEFNSNTKGASVKLYTNLIDDPTHSPTQTHSELVIFSRSRQVIIKLSTEWHTLQTQETHSAGKLSHYPTGETLPL
ncbi:MULTISPECIES: hypothetical protein [Pseudoalteromonas]|uniref:Uncharacterized protein n=1 Tax=Pseudoalteromonas amylolytica TaxID=1859457 RepID=A0A1S1MV68_9GAMM|nr:MULTISPECIES: hypothetical protein [Pseudoalteromonas]OHU87480.1 hypothetical protein BFC16_08445 [Pseudoalteromonas sp. JW3]OHU90923.1 hypothetical protein BET10_08560 [Pseudoalteromonas amylolytica]